VADQQFDIERPSSFYLGREYDLAKGPQPNAPPVMYEARDLLTHGVVVGMTGSGKTGLCINLLEEAAIDGISCIIIDVKGDLTNLLLQFPELKPDDFKKWLNPEDARIKKLSLDQYAEELSQSWKKGLEESLQSQKRIELLRDSSEFAIYTPGSDAGLPLAILKTFAAPGPGLPREELAQRLDATVAALLGLTGISRDPLQSREHVFISQLLMHAWNKGEDLDLAQLIGHIQTPPIRTIGAFDVDTFYPEKDRLKLALALNNLLASPSFATWIEGDPLDLSVLMKGPKPRQVIFYLAHLEDAQRMFFISLLLSEVLNWTRKQPGSSSLRNIIYFDEVFGYIPPHPANPPTKAPLMTLMKQARAFGVGVLLATQNPVDLDYKALSNAGTWMVGKLQTERDKARLIAGLEGVAAERGTLSDRGYLDNVISSLGNRVFLLHNVHQPKPVLLQSRWALSFLRGPMTREQVAELMKPMKEKRKPAEPAKSLTDSARGRAEDRAFREKLARSAAPSNGAAASNVAPGLPPGIAQYHLAVVPPVATVAGPDAPPPPKRSLLYRAAALGFAEVDFIDRKRGLELRRTYRLIADPSPDGSVTWASATPVAEQLAEAPSDNAHWGEVPDALNNPKKIKVLQKTFGDFLYTSARMALLESDAKLGLRSSPGEDLPSFQARCRTAARQQAEAALKKAEADYLAERQPLAEKLPAAPAPPPPSIFDLPVLNWFKQSPSKIVLGPEADNRTVARARERLEKLDADWQEQQRKLLREWDEAGNRYAELMLTPRKADIRVAHFGLAWVPYWRLTYSDGHTEVAPAFARELSPR
jgi:DNA helicase HerA-like ATPase